MSDFYFVIDQPIKELIKAKGFQVAPAELEALLLTHPPAVAVVPHPDEKTGEVLKSLYRFEKRNAYRGSHGMGSRKK